MIAAKQHQKPFSLGQQQKQTKINQQQANGAAPSSSEKKEMSPPRRPLSGLGSKIHLKQQKFLAAAAAARSDGCGRNQSDLMSHRRQSELSNQLISTDKDEPQEEKQQQQPRTKSSDGNSLLERSVVVVQPPTTSDNITSPPSSTLLSNFNRHQSHLPAASSNNTTNYHNHDHHHHHNKHHPHHKHQTPTASPTATNQHQHQYHNSSSNQQQQPHSYTMAHYKFHNDCQSSVLTYDQVKRLDFVMDQTVPIHGRGNFPTLYVKLKELIRLVKHKLQKEHSIDIHDVILNGGAASYVLAPENSHYNDLDLIFGTDLSNEDQFDVIRDVVLECLTEFYPKGQEEERAVLSAESSPEEANEKDSLSCSSVVEDNSESFHRAQTLSSCPQDYLRVYKSEKENSEKGEEEEKANSNNNYGDVLSGMNGEQVARSTHEYQLQQNYQMPPSKCAMKEAYVHKMVKVNDDDRWSLISLGVQQSEATCCGQATNCSSSHKQEASGQRSSHHVISTGEQQFVVTVANNNENEPEPGLINQEAYESQGNITGSATIVSSESLKGSTKQITSNYDPPQTQNSHNYSQRNHYQQPSSRQQQFPNSIELKFVDRMRRKFEFSVDSFQIILDSLIQFYDYAPQSTMPSQRMLINISSVASSSGCSSSSSVVSSSSSSLSSCDEDHEDLYCDGDGTTSSSASTSSFLSSTTYDSELNGRTSCAVISENIYPTVIGRSEYGNFKEALYHLEKKLIATRSPEEIRGGGLLKYCNLLVKNYKPTNVYQIRTLERYMCSRFFIDFSDLNQQQAKLESYLANHFSDDPIQKFDYLTILHNVVQRSTVCLMNHELRLTLNMIRDLAYKLTTRIRQIYVNRM